MECLLIIIILFIAIAIGPMVIVVDVVTPLLDRWRFRELRRWRRNLSRSESTIDPAETHRILTNLEAICEEGLDPSAKDELFVLFDQLCDGYLEGTPSLREELRKFFLGKNVLQKLLIQFTRLSALKLTKELEVSDNVQILRRGIASASIENIEIEFRETAIALEGIHKSALRVGIEPLKYFEEVREISSDDSPQYGCMRDFIGSDDRITTRPVGVLPMRQLTISRCGRLRRALGLHVSWARQPVMARIATFNRIEQGTP